MTLPDFLVIGAQRAGTTWLDNMLRTHPAIRMSRNRKEVHFFDQNYDKGIDWYGSFFEAEGSDSVRVGETTPHYLYHPEVPSRVAEVLPEAQLVAILRDPIGRAFSQYGHNVKSKGWTLSFEEAIEEDPQLLERGKYMDQLRRFLPYFGRDQLLVMIFEEVTREPESGARALGQFLGVNPDRFSSNLPQANASYVPRFARSYAAARSVGRTLRRTGLDAVVEGVKRVGAPRIFGTRGRLDPMSDLTRARLGDYFAHDREELEDFLGRRISLWA